MSFGTSYSAAALSPNRFPLSLSRSTFFHGSQCQNPAPQSARGLPFPPHVQGCSSHTPTPLQPPAPWVPSSTPHCPSPLQGQACSCPSLCPHRSLSPDALPGPLPGDLLTLPIPAQMSPPLQNPLCAQGNSDSLSVRMY